MSVQHHRDASDDDEPHPGLVQRAQKAEQRPYASPCPRSVAPGFTLAHATAHTWQVAGMAKACAADRLLNQDLR